MIDIGCNHGYGSQVIAGKAASVTGIDISQEAIAIAQQNNSMSNLQFMLAQADKLPFPDANFDAAVSFQVIEHIGDTNAYLAEIRRVVKPGGKVIFTTPNKVIRLAAGRAPWNRYHVREYTPGELAAVLRPVFESVTISGIYAKAAIYDVEYKRQIRKRQKQAEPGLRNLMSKLAHNIDKVTGWSERQTLARLGGAPTYRDFFYKTETDAGRLDDALDLRAICRR